MKIFKERFGVNNPEILIFCFAILLLFSTECVIAEAKSSYVDDSYTPDKSVYIKMTDGVRIAADIYLPDGS